MKRIQLKAAIFAAMLALASVGSMAQTRTVRGLVNWYYAGANDVRIKVGTVDRITIDSTFTSLLAPDGGGYLKVSNGVVTVNSATLSLASSGTSRGAFANPSADGVLQWNASGGTIGVEMAVGAANPTATTCGTGTVTAHSTNVAGEVTATGATTCTLTFGATAFTNQPFCTVTDETTAAALRISAISTTSFTVTNLTAGDKFLYVCLGGK